MWQIIGASVRGTSHERTNTPCQDSHDFRLVNGDIMLAAVADGLGSAGKSDIGASLAVKSILDVLESRLSVGLPTTDNDWVSLLQHSFATTRAALEDYACKEDIILRELGTTLLVAVCHPDWLAVGHLGDGAIVGAWEEDVLLLISPPDHSEYAGQVCPITANEALEYVRYALWPHCPPNVVMMSDGLQQLALDATNDQPYLPFFLPLIHIVRKMDDAVKTSEELRLFLDSNRINARTADDKTLVIINYKPLENQGPAAGATKSRKRQ